MYIKILRTQKRVLDAVTNFLMEGENPDDAKESPDVSGEDSSFDHSDAITPYSSLSWELLDDTNDNASGRKLAEETEPTEPGIIASGAQQERVAQRNEKTAVPYEEFKQTHLHSRTYRLAKNRPKGMHDHPQ
ncbi:unnamed protein product [Taenia asiatica]|uniref:Uncharacterized protein n=1 Tax=Taenia asiatica TaxID=60517 RepID=A0A0R3WFI5_TAEAS|nr:unnamed protein product [Taenia asiatica]